MLSFFRKTLTSWPVLILLGVLLVAFAVTGVSDPFGSRRAPQGSVARVGDKVITEPALERAFDRLVRQQQEANPQVNRTQLAKAGAVQALSEQLIGQTALEQLAIKLGIVASDRLIGGEIGSIAAFQSGGKFDQATFKRVIDQNRLTEREVRDDIAGGLVRRQLLAPVLAAGQTPAGMAEPYARLMLDLHKGAYSAVPATASAPPTDAEVLAYYNANKGRFTLPERRAFRYALLDRAAIAAKAQPSDAEIADAYAKEPEKYGAAATRKLQQVVVPDETKARAIADAARSEGFEKAATRLAGVSLADVDIGEQSQKQFAEATSADVAKAAFALPAGGISAPLKSDFGWHVVHVSGLGQGGKSLAEARPAIVAELGKRAGDKAVATLVNKIEDGLEARQSFADIAKANGLTIVAHAPVTKDGQDNGATVPADMLPLVQKVFGQDPTDGAIVNDLGGGRMAVIETTQVLPSAPRPLADIRAEATAAAAADKALKAAKAKADAVVAAVKAGKDFAAALAAQGLDAPRPIEARRADLQGAQVPAPVQLLLTTSTGAVATLQGQQGVLLVQKLAVVPGDLKTAPQLVPAAQTAFAGQAPEELATAFAMAAEHAVKTERNQATVNTIARRLAGEIDAQ